MRESKKVEAFLLLFDIEFLESLDCYMQGWDLLTRGKRITPDAIRKIKELYYFLNNGTTTIKTGGGVYYPLSIDAEFIRRVSAINREINKDLQHFKDTSIGLWCTDKEPKDKTNFFRLK